MITMFDMTDINVLYYKQVVKEKEQYCWGISMPWDNNIPTFVCTNSFDTLEESVEDAIKTMVSFGIFLKRLNKEQMEQLQLSINQDFNSRAKKCQ